MQKAATLRGGLLLTAALVAGLIAALYATRSNGAGTGGGARVVMTAKNKTLGKTILVNRRGMTLYSLSVERHGKFICKNASCLAVWKPLAVRKGTKPTGVSRLSTVKRPDGKTQVTYRGAPLYTFTQDRKPGDVKGNGLKDVGTWRVITVATSVTPPPPPPPPPPPTYTYVVP